MDLVSVLGRLYASEIDVSIISRWDAGWQLDIEGGQVARAFVRRLEDAAGWFHEQALIHFPDSMYAKTCHEEVRRAISLDIPMRRLS